MTKERPILFSGPMVRAILDGRKTMTRRVVRAYKIEEAQDVSRHANATGATNTWVASRWPDGRRLACNRTPLDTFLCPYGIPGDRLWVRETFATRLDVEADTEKAKQYVKYRADREGDDFSMDWHDYGDKWRPSIHMPRWASRITLEVAGVRVERLQEITDADAIAEGCKTESFTPADYRYPRSDMWRSIAHKNFTALWESLNGPRGFGWDANPWVWVVSFRRVEGT